MAKGQKKSNKEARKPKQAGSKSAKTPNTFLASAHAGSVGSKSTGRPKGP